MSRVSKPMKIITLRIDPEEKARLEHLAEAGDITLSRALREGAALYLNDLQSRLGRARGQNVTWHGVKRDSSGRPVGPGSRPTARQAAQVDELRSRLCTNGLQQIRRAWDEHGEARPTLAAIAQWLSVVGQLYVSDRGEIGWSWFLRDYGGPFSASESSAMLQRELRACAVREPAVNVSAVIDALDAGLAAFLRDVESQTLVRRAVLPAWQVLREELGA